MPMPKAYRRLPLLSVISRGTFVILMASSGGCSWITGPDDGAAEVVRHVSALPAWSADGRTIYFTDRQNGGITQIFVKAVDVPGGRTRTLGTVRGLNHGEQVRTSADGTAIYASIAHPDWSLQLSIYRVPAAGGQLEPIAANVGVPWFVASGSGNRVAYPGPRFDSDTLFVADAIPGAIGNMVAIPSVGTRPRAMGLSSDGARLLYSSSSGIYLVPATGGIHQEVCTSSSGGAISRAPQVIWRGQVPFLLLAEAAVDPAVMELSEYNCVTGEKAFRGRLPRPLKDEGNVQLAWSADGRSFAAWIPVEVVRRTVERTTYRFRLYVEPPDVLEATPSIELVSGQPVSWLEFAPDARRIAHVLSGSLRIIPVGR